MCGVVGVRLLALAVTGDWPLSVTNAMVPLAPVACLAGAAVTAFMALAVAAPETRLWLFHWHTSLPN